MKHQVNVVTRVSLVLLAVAGLSYAQVENGGPGREVLVDDDPVLLLPDRDDSSATFPAENIPPAGSVPARQGAATGRAQGVQSDRRLAQAPLAPAVPEIPRPRLSAFEILTASEKHTTFVTALRSVGLASTLRGKGQFTILAPDNAAFASLPEGVAENLLLPENRNLLRSILSYHIIPQRLAGRDLLPGGVRSLQGESLEFVGGLEGVVTIQDARILQADVAATNGLIHGIDLVLVPLSIAPFLIEYYAFPPVEGLVSPFEGLDLSFE